MKTTSLILATVTWIFTGLCAYFLFFAYAGPDGLGTFFSILICGGIGLCFLIAFLIHLPTVKNITKIQKVLYAILVLLPVILILMKVFYVPMISEYTIETIE